MRTGLEKTRDVLLCVMAALVSILCAATLYFGFTVGSALAQLSDRLDPSPAVSENFEPAPTNPNGEECVGEEPPPGC